MTAALSERAPSSARGAKKLVAAGGHGDLAKENRFIINMNRADPTRTTMIRQRMMQDLTARFIGLKGAIRRSIVDNDCFGLKTQRGSLKTIAMAKSDITATAVKEFAGYERNAQKVQGFMTWLKDQEQRGIIETFKMEQLGSSIDPGWNNTYVTSSYQKHIRDAYGAGIMRGRGELVNAGYDVQSLAKAPGGFQSAFNSPVHMDRVGAVYTRTFAGLTDVTGSMDAEISRWLAQGLMEGKSPLQLASKANAIVDKIGIPRARTLARTEVIRAHHLATIQEYKNAEAIGVYIVAEFTTAGDSRVCEKCADFEGRRGEQRGGGESPRTAYSLDEVEGMIPAHPNCRCIALPVDKTDAVATKARVLEPPPGAARFPDMRAYMKTISSTSPVAAKKIRQSFTAWGFDFKNMRAFDRGVLKAKDVGGVKIYNTIARQTERINTALSQVKGYRGTVYRGMGITEAQYNTLIDQKVLTVDALTSTSADAKIAKQFAVARPGTKHVLLEIRNNKSGVLVQDMMGTAAGEAEVLVPRNTKWRLISIEKNAVSWGGQKMDRIIVEEITDVAAGRIPPSKVITGIVRPAGWDTHKPMSWRQVEGKWKGAAAQRQELIRRGLDPDLVRGLKGGDTRKLLMKPTALDEILGAKPPAALGGLSDSEYQALLRKTRATALTEDELAAIRRYQLKPARGGTYEKINTALRGSDGDINALSEKLRADVQALDSMVTKAPVASRNTLVYRGVANPSDDLLASLRVGREYVDQGFISTTADSTVSKRFKGIMFEIEVPKGQRLPAFPTSATREILLPRGSRFDVISKRIVDGRTHYTLRLKPLRPVSPPPVAPGVTPPAGWYDHPKMTWRDVTARWKGATDMRGELIARGLPRDFVNRLSYKDTIALLRDSAKLDEVAGRVVIKPPRAPASPTKIDRIKRARVTAAEKSERAAMKNRGGYTEELLSNPAKMRAALHKKLAGDVKTLEGWVNELPPGMQASLNRDIRNIKFAKRAGKATSGEYKHYLYGGDGIYVEVFSNAKNKRWTFFHEAGHSLDHYYNISGYFKTTPADGNFASLRAATREAWKLQKKRVTAAAVKEGLGRKFKWQFSGWIPDANKIMLSPYSNVDAGEFFAEAVMDYCRGGQQLKRLYPKMYAAMRDSMFQGKTYATKGKAWYME